MDELLVHASGRKLRWFQLCAAGLAVVLPVAAVALGLGTSQWIAVVLLVLASVSTVGGLELRIRRPKPELRLSTDGVEGAFGLIRWEDVTSAELLRHLRVHARGIVLRLRPGALLHPSSGDFADAGIELSPGQLVLETRGLELGPEELLREIERFRLYASG